MNKLKRFLALVLAMSMMLTLVPFGVFAAVASAPTTNLSTENAPFKQGTGESNSFRIPAMVTLSDGTLVAAADARWNTTYDGGGLDTMVAVSKDNGATWTHSFANYLGDNGNSYNYNSTCFIDPSLAVTDDDTIYMLCDLYPYGVALNGSYLNSNPQFTAPSYDTGFDSNGNLILNDDAGAQYYLKDGEIYDSGNNVVDGYTVDGHFNIQNDDGTVDTNLFYSDSPYKVKRTGFLYLTKGTYDSTSKTISWSDPQLLNLKNDQEMVCLVGPGRGLVTSGGTIYFPVYSYDGETKKYTGLVYSSDGTNWTRTDNFTDEISSEAALVELDNGNIRVFFRNEKSELRYTDYSTYFGFGDAVSTGVKVNSDTELSAISYSKTINGNQVILVSAPAGPNAAGTNDNNGAYRSSGKIFCGIADKTDSVRTMTWKTGSVGVTPVATSAFSGSTYTADMGFFAYSCLTELTNNSVAILYEDSQQGWGAGNGYGYTMAYKTYTEEQLQTAFGVTFDGNTPEEGTTTVNVTLSVGDTVNKTIEGVSLNGSYSDSVASVTWTGTEAATTYATATLGSTAAFGETTIDVANCLYTFTETSNGVWEITGTTSDGTTVYMYPGNSKNGTTDRSSGYPNCTEGNLPSGLEVYVLEGAETGSVYLKSSTNVWGNPAWLQFNRSTYRWDRVENVNSTNYQTNGSLYLYRAASADETSSTEIPGYVKVASYADVVSGGKYLIAAPGADGATYIAYPSTSTATLYNQIAKVTGQTASDGTATASTDVTITGKAVGNTKVAVGTTTYNITVNAKAKTVVDVELKVDESKTYTDGSGVYTSAATAPDSAIAGMTIAGNPPASEASYAVADTLESGAKYLITINNRMVTSNTSTGYNGSWSSAKGLLMTDDTTNQEQYLWTITKVTGGYTLMNADGKYMNIAAENNNITLSDTPVVVSVIDNGSTFTIHNNNYCLNNFGGSNVFASCYSGTSDANAKWTLKKYTPAVVSTATDITFTGVALGKTTAVVGDTIYNISVVAENVDKVVDIELEVDEKYTYVDTTGGYTSAVIEPDDAIVDMTVKSNTQTGEATYAVADTLESGAKYLITIGNSMVTSNTSTNGYNGYWSGAAGLLMTTDTTDQEQYLWTITQVDGGYTFMNADGKYLNIAAANNNVTLSETAVVLSVIDNGSTFTIHNNNYCLNNFGGNGWFASCWSGTDDPNAVWTLKKYTPSVTTSTEITFTGVSAGTTAAVVGTTQYNITVKADGEYVNLEVGETLTYTDTTGNYVDAEGNVQPNNTYASMTLAPGKALKLVTTLESGKQYLIVNKVTGAVLTDTEMKVTGDYGNKDGLATTGSASADSKELWTITSVDGGYTVEQGGKYLAVAGFEAHMYDTAVPLTLSHTLDGWLIYDYTTGPALDHADAGYYLTDNAGSNYINGALGTSDTTNTYRYWDIYEILPLNTEIIFTGNKVGTTTAKVGSTTYYITVEEYILDDEINDSTNGYTVNAELQRTRYNELIKNVAKDLYTDESWPAYEAARKAAFAKLGEVDGTTYATEAEAQAAVAELVAAIDALEAAKKTLVAAQTITIHYQLDGTTILSEEYKVAANATTLTLPDVIVVDKQTYTISENQSSDDEDEQITITDGVLTLPENDTVVYVAVEKGVALGNGFVGSQDITGLGTHNNDVQQALIEDKKITEMTLTTGVTYDLDLADTLADGQTVTWTSSNEDAATVDEDGLVTPVAAGTTTITATIKDADGNIVSVNSIPVTVFEGATTDRVSALYIENIDNTTVYCVVNADTDAKAFEVIEGELIYGYFDTTVDDNTATTAFSFFGDPDEAHALVAMTSTNSFGDYYLLHDDDGNPGIGTEYYRLPDDTTGAGYWQAIGLTDNNHDGKADWTKIESMIKWAIANGCDGGFGFTRRQGEKNIGSNLTFISDPMPKIEKEVDGVLPTSRLRADYRRYTDGMVAAVHELVYFKLTVTLERPIVWETDSAGNVVTSTDEDGNVYKHGAIVYTNAIVEDTVLKGAYLYTKELDQADGVYDGEIEEDYRTQTQDITDQLNAPWADNETVRTLELYLLYEIQESDIPKFYIDNIAYLNYDYESHYSTGAQAGAADAEARISVVGTAIDNVVIDFGQSFTYEGHEYTSITDGKTYTFDGLTNTHLKGAYVDGVNDIAGITASKATAKYGDVKVTRTARIVDGVVQKDEKGYTLYDYTVTYTPTQILQGVDTVLIYGYGDNNQEKIINGFLVYPATTVYYEEGFILNDDSTWSGAGSAKATADQTFELLGASQFDVHGQLTHKISNKKHAYGYDPIYNGDGTNDVAKSAITSSTVGDSTTFTFTGDGFEIFADSTASTGKVSVQVKNSAGKFVKVFTVDTAATEGYTGVTVGQTVNLDSLPIVSWHSDNHDTYTVTVQKIAETELVVIDGVRIFNTLNEADYNNEDGTANSPFKIDLEDDPDFYQLRDYVLYALNIGEDTSVDYRDMCDQVYELMGEDQAAVILDVTEDPYKDEPIINGTVYTTTTTKTTVTVIEYTDGTSVVITRVDTVLEEYADEAKIQKILTRIYTEDSTEYYAENGKTTSEEFGDVTAKEVLFESVGEPTVMTVEGQKTIYTTQDLLDNGPKNELYLHKGESLVFKVSTNRMMQIGLKAPQGSATYSLQYTMNDGDPVKVAENAALNTSVDMFYELYDKSGKQTNAAEYVITVTNNGENILSVTDLKICDDPNAVFTPLTEEDVESVLLSMGYSASCTAGHTYEDGFCTVCGIGTARNTNTGVDYGTVADALNAAAAGETVVLLTDCTAGNTMVTNGVTLDLNGFNLTASYIVAFEGNHVIDSVGTGSLIAGEKSLVLDETNAMVPVYNGSAYLFTKAGFAISQDTNYTGEGIKINAVACPVNMDVVELLKDGSADNNIQIVIRLTWDTDQGTGSQEFSFTDKVISDVYSSNNGSWAGYSKMFGMTITGFEEIANLKANIVIVSGTGVEYASATPLAITE